MENKNWKALPEVTSHISNDNVLDWVFRTAAQDTRKLNTKHMIWKLDTNAGGNLIKKSNEVYMYYIGVTDLFWNFICSEDFCVNIEHLTHSLQQNKKKNPCP